MLFLASYPKSGSTWIRTLISGWHGSTDINNLEGVFSDVSSLVSGARRELSFEERLLLIPAKLIELESEKPSPIIVKTHNINALINGINPVPPQMTKGAIYVVRDPRDVAISYAHHLGKPIDKAIDLMGDSTTGMLMQGRQTSMMGSWSDHVSSWIRKLPYGVLVLRYEDLLADTEEEFNRICISLGWSTERTKEIVQACEFSKLKAQEKSNGFKEKSDRNDLFFRSGKSEWQDVLTDAQVARIESDHGKMMSVLNYKLTTLQKVV